MDKTFTLAQLLTVGILGLATGYLASNATAHQSKSSKNASHPNQKSHGSKPKAVSSLTSTNATQPAAGKKSKGIKEDSEDYLSEGDDDEFSDDEGQDDDEEEEESEDEENEDLVDFKLKEEFKMVLVIRSDLGMGKGKAAAQCCHATLANYKELARKSPGTLNRWEYFGQAKVTLKIDNEQDMLLLQAQARSIGLAAHSIRDAGRTQIAAGSRTVLAIGPGPKSIVDQITGKLKLY